VLIFPTVLVLHGTISFEAHACRDLATTFATGITYAGKVPTDDLPRSAFAIVFSNLRVRPRPAKEEPDPPKMEGSPRRLLNALLPLSEGSRITGFRFTAEAAESDAVAASGEASVLLVV
jgi:hypothetical protein